MGIFGDIFDFNDDGKLDAFEKGAEFGAFMQMVDSCEQDESESDETDIDYFDL